MRLYLCYPRVHALTVVGVQCAGRLGITFRIFEDEACSSLLRLERMVVYTG